MADDAAQRLIYSAKSTFTHEGHAFFRSEEILFTEYDLRVKLVRIRQTDDDDGSSQFIREVITFANLSTTDCSDQLTLVHLTALSMISHHLVQSSVCILAFWLIEDCHAKVQLAPLLFAH